MARKKGKPLHHRLGDLRQLEAFSHEVIAFNDHYHLRVTAPNGETIDYYPVSEKYKRSTSKIYLVGLGNLIDYLNEQAKIEHQRQLDEQAQKAEQERLEAEKRKADKVLREQAISDTTADLIAGGIPKTHAAKVVKLIMDDKVINLSMSF